MRSFLQSLVSAVLVLGLVQTSSSNVRVAPLALTRVTAKGGRNAKAEEMSV
jgi:hypothetical protein